VPDLSESDRIASSATILQLADIHLRADDGEVYGEDPERRLGLVLAACARELGAVDLIVLTGDQSDDGEPGALERLSQILDRIGAPILAIPGNHDGPDVQRATFGDLTPVEVGGWRLAGLDSSVPGEIHGAVDIAGVESLLDDLDERPTLLALHHPPVPPTSHPWFRLENARRLLACLTARPQVRAVLSGHVHAPFEHWHGPLQLLGGPSTLAPFGFDGEELTVGAGGPTGARAISLRADGALDSRLIEA
jgi:3',5'-cyclic-AMP phosphodiesterase